MIREYGPILLIPAAWIMSFLTMVYPGIDTYWIAHMHYFITGFLAVFALTSWKKMDKPVLKTWRLVILLGIFATAAGALSFHIEDFSSIFGGISVFYWLLAPGLASYYTSESLGEYSKAFRFTGYGGITAFLLFLQGVVVDSQIFLAAGIITAIVSQTSSIVLAARMDGNI